MLPVYKYSQVKVIHFDIEKNQLEAYLNSRDRLRIIRTYLIPKYLIYDMIDEPKECRLDIRYTFRLLDEEEKTSFGSYISEQFFYIKYIDDHHTKSQIKHLFSNSQFMSEQEFNKLKEKNNLPKDIRFTHYTFPDSVIEEVFEILKQKS